MSLLGSVLAAVGGDIIGGLIGSDSSRHAANTQADAAKYAADVAAAQRKPWVDAAKPALDRLSAGIAPGGEFAKKFTMADATNMPAYRFALGEGLNAIENSAAARGGLLSTNALHEATKFAEGTAASFQNQAFNQWLAQMQQTLQPIEALAQIGGNMAGQVGDAYGNAALAAGNARAGGIVGSANAWGNAINNIGNDPYVMRALERLFTPIQTTHTVDYNSGNVSGSDVFGWKGSGGF